MYTVAVLVLLVYEGSDALEFQITSLRTHLLVYYKNYDTVMVSIPSHPSRMALKEGQIICALEWCPPHISCSLFYWIPIRPFDVFSYLDSWFLTDRRCLSTMSFRFMNLLSLFATIFSSM